MVLLVRHALTRSPGSLVLGAFTARNALPVLPALSMIVTAGAFLLACESSASPPPSTPANDMPASSAAPASSGGAAGAAGGEHHHHEVKLAPAGPNVTVSLDGKPTDIVLASVPHEGASAPLLLTLWKTAFPNEDPSALHFDMFGSDGFHPASRPTCARVLTGADLATSRIDLATHDLTFDADSKLPGCYRVKGVVRVEASH